MSEHLPIILNSHNLKHKFHDDVSWTWSLADKQLKNNAVPLLRQTEQGPVQGCTIPGSLVTMARGFCKVGAWQWTCFTSPFWSHEHCTDVAPRCWEIFAPLGYSTMFTTSGPTHWHFKISSSKCWNSAYTTHNLKNYWWRTL